MNRYQTIEQIKQSYREQLPEVEEEWPPKVRRAAKCIHTHLFNPRLTVGWMKQQCRINGHNFASRFAYCVGETPKQYILYHRIAVAKQLLAKNDHENTRISTIAYEVGFTDPSTFSQCFKQHTPMSPSRLRKEQLDG